MKPVNVILNGLVLKTIYINYCRPEVMGTSDWLYCFNNYDFNFPDSDKIYCEDIEGHRYKRVFPEPLVNGFFYFKQI